MNDVRDRFKALGKKLKEQKDESIRYAEEKLREGANSNNIPVNLPDDLRNYLLTLKREIGLPVSVLPASMFKKPRFLGREEFFHRLASELVPYGLAHQRVNLEPVRLSRLTSSFHKHRPGWDVDIQDIEAALGMLNEQGIIGKSTQGFLFEPLTLSRDVHNFLAWINEGITTYGEISIEEIYDRVPWDNSKVDYLIELLVQNKICIINSQDRTLFFPSFTRG
ncbi:MAG: hypothetical protein ACFFE8_08705 [Candidatus Heimdallarchaeota archaeon]